MIAEAMSITPIIFVLVILLFGFDSARTVKDPLETQLRLTIAREMSEF
jgi:hypothetical protein